MAGLGLIVMVMGLTSGLMEAGLGRDGLGKG